MLSTETNGEASLRSKLLILLELVKLVKLVMLVRFAMLGERKN